MKKSLFTISLLLISIFSFAQLKEENVKLMELVKDIIITQKEEDNMQQIWVLPEEYWGFALNDSSHLTPEIVDEIKNIIGGYLIIAALDINISPLGALESNDITISLLDKNDIKYQPIDFDQLDDEVYRIVNVLKPSLESMLGNLGEQLELYVFKNTNDNKEDILTPYETGKITIKLNDSNFVYKTPFSSLVKRKSCPVDAEELNGNWDFCPWHGIKLLYN